MFCPFAPFPPTPHPLLAGVGCQGQILWRQRVSRVNLDEGGCRGLQVGLGGAGVSYGTPTTWVKPSCPHPCRALAWRGRRSLRALYSLRAKPTWGSLRHFEDNTAVVAAVGRMASRSPDMMAARRRLKAEMERRDVFLTSRSGWRARRRTSRTGWALGIRVYPKGPGVRA